MILKEHVSKLMALAFATTLIACNNSTENNPDSLKDTASKNEVPETQTIASVTEISVNNIDSVPDQIKYEGKIVDAKMWKVKSGEHYVFITEKK